MRLEIHYTYKCNQNCVFCPVLRHPKKDPSLSDIKKVLTNISKKDIVDISGGEPTLRKDIFELISAIRKKTKKVYITTNAILLNKRMIEKFIERGITTFLISFHSHLPEITKKITKVDSFPTIYTNLKLLSNYNVNIITNTIITKYNADTIIDTIKFMHNNFNHISKHKITYPRYYKFKKVTYSCKTNLLSLSECKQYLSGIKYLPRDLKSKVYIENIPKCVLKHNKNNDLDWDAKLLTIDGIVQSLDNKRYYMQKCIKCKSKSNCQGLHKFYNLYFDDFKIVDSI